LHVEAFVIPKCRFLEKPFTPASFASKVREVLEAPSPE